MMSQRSDPEPPQLLPASVRESAGFCKLNLIHVTKKYFTSSLSVPSRKLTYDARRSVHVLRISRTFCRSGDESKDVKDERKRQTAGREHAAD